MERFVKIKRPFKVFDARIKAYKDTLYAECLVSGKEGTQIVAMATKSATQQLLDVLDGNLQYELAKSQKSGQAVLLSDLNIVAWLTANQYGHCITFIRKE